MKKLILTTIIILTSFFAIPKVEAYVQIDNNTTTIIKPINKDITNVNVDWGDDIRYSLGSPWLYSASQYWWAGDLNGSILQVRADYYVGIKSMQFTDGSVNNYLYNEARNTLTADNLRCGIGNYKTGYDSSYLPTVTNFSVTYEYNIPLDQHLYHIKFDYSQVISKVDTSSNMSCWFERNPSNGLFAQALKGLTDQAFTYYYYNKTFDYIVTNDQNTLILGDIESGINETNNKLDNLNQTQQETNNQLNDLNENINNDNTDEATNEASEFFSTFQTDTFGLTSIITAPLTLIQSITSTTCSPLGLPLPYVDKTLNLPCLSSIYEEYFGVFLDIYQTITFGIVAYWVCVRIFNLVKDFKNPDHDEIEVLDL